MAHSKATPINTELSWLPGKDALYGYLSIITFYWQNSGDTDSFFLWENDLSGKSGKSGKQNKTRIWGIFEKKIISQNL